MRALTERQAAACETATTPRCRCRCGGALHGAARTRDLYELPAGDPHHPRERQLELEETACAG